MPLKCRKCKDTGIVTTWEQLLPFNPQSSDQVKALFHALKLKVPKKRGEDRETTEQKYLKRLKKRYPVFGAILDVRKRGKLLSDYMWQPDSEGTIRTTFGHHPSTWRKSSRGPNLQVIPRANYPVCFRCGDEGQLTDVADLGRVWWCAHCNCVVPADLQSLVRETVCAPPGHVLMSCDSEGIEGVLVGYDTGSERMIKIAKAGEHGYFLSHVKGQGIDWQLPFAELKKACKSFKRMYPVEYEQCKRCVHGTHYGLTPYGMADEYEEIYKPTEEHIKEGFKTPLKVAEKYQNQLFGVLPEVKTWMATKRQLAHTQRFLDNHFGYRHYFYNVFSYDSKRGQYVLGEDGKRCVAFTPQSDGSACQSEYILGIEERAETDGDSPYRLLSQSLRLLIHDDLTFCIPLSEVKPCAQAAASVMNMAFPELAGLRIGVEVKVGENLRDQSVVEVEQQL